MNAQVLRLKDEIESLKALIEKLPEELQKGPYGKVYQARRERLLVDLATLELKEVASIQKAPALDLRLFRSDEREHSIAASVLGDMLKIFQSFFSALGQAAMGKPTSRGNIPTEITRATTLNVCAFAEGSFITRVVLEKPNQVSTEPWLGSRAFDLIRTLHNARDSRSELKGLMQKLKGRVLGSYVALLKKLHDSHYSLQITIAEPGVDDVREVCFRDDFISDVMPALENASKDEEANEMTYVGTLNAANRRTGTFEIDLGAEGTLSGRVSTVGILDGVVIGLKYEFKLSEVFSRKELTDNPETELVLERIISLGSN